MDTVGGEGPAIELKAVSKSYEVSGDSLLAVRDFSLSIEKGQFVSVVGPSGCGKTTLLRLIAGLIQPSDGHVRVDGREVLGPSADVVLLFQEYGRSLLPWRTVPGNVQFGLEGRGVPREERVAEAERQLALVGLKGFEAYYPWQLSGGMQQRVALARALVCSPKVLLLDEPFGSLDAISREQLEDQLLALWCKLGFTAVLVTHDVDEAIYLGQCVVVLSQRPASLCTTEAVDLPYPRSQIESRSSARFLELRAELRRALGAR